MLAMFFFTGFMDRFNHLQNYQYAVVIKQLLQNYLMAQILQNHKSPLTDQYLLADVKKEYMNPISKATFEALPRIYGRSKKKKYLLKYQLQTKEKTQPTEQKNRPFESNITIQERPSIIKRNDTELKKDNLSVQKRWKVQMRSFDKKHIEEMSQPRKQICTKRYCYCNKQHISQVTQSLQKQNSNRLNKIASIRLPEIDKNYEPDDIQSKHKVVLTTIDQKDKPPNTQRSNYTLLDLLRNTQKKTKGDYNNRLPEESRKNQTQYIKEIETKQVEIQFPARAHNVSVQTQDNQLDNDQISPQAKGKTQPFDPKLQQSARKINTSNQNRPIIKTKAITDQDQMNFNKQRLKLQQLKLKQLQMEAIDSESEDSRSIKSSISSASLSKYVFQSDKKTNTMFHSLKKKETSSAKSERLNKTEEKTDPNAKKFTYQKKSGLFIIPEENQYVPFLKNYEPLNQKFSIKKLVRKPNFKVCPQEEGVFFGELDDQKKNGKGIMVTERSIFEGHYKDDIKTYGYQKNVDGVYKGQFVNGVREGYGSFEWNNGQIFEGQWKNGTKNGYGTWRSPKGDYYEGNWLLNRQHGKGIFKHKISTYRGHFTQFLKEGEGQQFFANGDKYTGSYKQGKPDGIGRYDWADGSFFQGTFVGGVRHGKGKWVYSNGTIYQGQFKNDFKDGQGKEVYKSGERFEGIFCLGAKKEGILYDIHDNQITITNNNEQ